MQLAISRLFTLLIVLSALASHAQGVSDFSSSPYAAIAARKVFALQDVIPAPIEPPKPIEPPASIQLVGAKDYQGVRSAILTIQQIAKPGQPATSKTYTIKEGETRGPITVMQIANVKTGEMEIVNNGTTMKIDFKSHAGKLPVTAAPNLPPGVIAPGAIPGMPAPLPTVGSAVPQPFASPAARTVVPSPVNRDFGAINATTRPLRAGGSLPLGVSNSGFQSAAQPAAPQETVALTREAQAIAIEINRQRTQEAVKMGLMPPLPPTELSPLTPSQDQ